MDARVIISILALLFVHNVHSGLKNNRVRAVQVETEDDPTWIKILDIVSLAKPAINKTLSFFDPAIEGIVANETKIYVNAAVGPITNASDVMKRNISSLEQKLDHMHFFFKEKLTNLEEGLNAMNSSMNANFNTMNAKMNANFIILSEKMDNLSSHMFMTQMTNMNRNIQLNNKLITDLINNKTAT